MAKRTRKKLPPHLAKLLNTPQKRRRAAAIMKKGRAEVRARARKKPLDQELFGLLTDFGAAPVNVLTEGFTNKKKMKRRR